MAPEADRTVSKFDLKYVMEVTQVETEFVQFLISRLERLSADSHWAHRASGVRGALLKAIDPARNTLAPKISPAQVDILIRAGFELLEKAAREIPDREKDLRNARQNLASQVK